MTKEQLAKLGITIEGETITEDEAFALIEKHHNEIANERNKLKKRSDELSSENAEYKRKAQEQLSEDEKQKLKYQEMEKEIASLKRKDSLNTKVNDLMSLGYDKELATKFANAELDGKSTVDYQKQFMEAQLEKQKQELLKKTPNPQQGDPNSSVKTKEDFDKLGYEAQLKLYNEHREIYDKFANSK